MNDLEALLLGKPNSRKHFKYAGNLDVFPQCCFDLADTLEILDISGNQLQVLPSNFDQFRRLKILFLSQNRFQVFPSVLQKCAQLEMIGFKSNAIAEIPENSFPKSLRWLILTDNAISNIPTQIGECLRLQKLMLAGNRLKDLPDSIAACKQLELIRISANRMKTIPKVLQSLPKLRWIAFNGNPIQTPQNHRATQLKTFFWDDLEMVELLGSGASGTVYKVFCRLHQKHFALKLFKGEVTSDGFPSDEIEIAQQVGSHPNLIPIHGLLANHPEQKSGLVLELLPSHFTALAGPPSFETCTRDVVDRNKAFSEMQTWLIAFQCAEVLQHMHKQGLVHGDFYAHNILIGPNTQIYLSDFGAASKISPEIAQWAIRTEIRAFACLLEDLIQMTSTTRQEWIELIEKCHNQFDQMQAVIDALNSMR